MPCVSNVLIVGGGIAGMSLGIALKQAGIHSEIVERDMTGAALGVGISLQSPALRALGALGVLDRCVEAGFGYSSCIVCDADGNRTGTVELPNLIGPEYPATIGIMRHSVQSVLAEALAAKNVPIHRGETVADFEQTGRGVNVQFGTRESATYDLMVGADGAYSKVRSLLFGDECQPTYTGQAVWRATVRRPHEVKARYSYNGPRSKCGFNPVTDQQMYIYLHQTLPEFVRWPEEQLPALMQEHLAEFGGLLSTAREEITRPEQIIYRGITSCLLPPPWYRGRVVVIGDAAHTTAPHLASGAGMAIEDAVVLAALLGSESSPSNALHKFMTRRLDRCRMVVKNALRLGEWEMNPNAYGADDVGLLEESFKALAQPI